MFLGGLLAPDSTYSQGPKDPRRAITQQSCRSRFPQAYSICKTPASPWTKTSLAWQADSSPNQMPKCSLHFPSSNQNAVRHINIHSRLLKHLKREANIATELSLGGMGVPSIIEGLVVIGLEFVPFCHDDDSMRTITSLLWTLGEDKLIP